MTTGYSDSGKRRTRSASGRTKTEAKEKLRELVSDRDAGLTSDGGYTVADAVTSWLAHGLHGRNPKTVENYRYNAQGHILPFLGRRKLRELSAEDVELWLSRRAAHLSTRTLRLLHSILSRSVRHAQARDKVARNVVNLCDIPGGRPGRPSKSLTLEQAMSVLDAAVGTPLHAYIVLSLLIGARPEELRPLTWDHVDLHGRPAATPPVPRSIEVWHSVRAGGDTKTKKSRRTLALPLRCVVALRLHRLRQVAAAKRGGRRWDPRGLVFPSTAGTQLDAHNVRRAFRRVIKAAGLPPEQWTPRELRHSFVSVMSASGVPVEDIARLVGHSGTAVTERVYRKEIRPALNEGAKIMDTVFQTR
ncbi:site-specific integrase [Actinoalloteichus caeruleus]|uniref:Site-specific recombinase XerD n=1 Tax=Actinoalloteichus caeruleus DSM 43889 TaxID=1120930 RepID=A0ABT1JG28_ACTCY|nr:site-specific integrase [Actinoalloteichus caeruleus]MCP2330731.1 Site-specific recombinase XerD [Actinoalloteichus caeruleus DSM 43889]